MGHTFLLATYLHQMSPFLWEIMPGIGIRWYGLSYLAGALIGAGIVMFMAGRGRSRLPQSLVVEFAFNVLIGAFVGGRLGFCLLYEPKLLGFIDEFPYWGVLAIQQGGMASHGGMIGMLVAIVLFARKHHIPLWHLLDVTCLVGPIGVMLGRMANLINGELYGRACSADLSWGVKFPKEIYTWEPDQMKQLAPIAEMVGIEPAAWLTWLNDPERFSAFISAGISKMLDAIEHHSQPVAAAIEPMLTARYPSQLIQAVLEGLLVFVILALLWSRPRKPGVVSAVFVCLYAIARIIGEQFRMPDPELGFELFGLTRGQELSFIMLMMGIALLVYTARRSVDKEPAWIGPTLPGAADHGEPFTQ
jgi:phosphatidylglycerol---prolipoprotein diacylglyceryl transferase